jgi:hypothetical protein
VVAVAVHVFVHAAKVVHAAAAVESWSMMMDVHSHTSPATFQ